ncbi:DEAD-box ATP-dependent RNA helicase CshA [Clostridiaceae bacterium JG1575]|nr:DEAD-box ATP-dependent RNA helicase CshA [Clostridiaceae bacterium JG1575]
MKETNETLNQKRTEGSLELCLTETIPGTERIPLVVDGIEEAPSRRFEDLGLSPAVLEAIAEMGFEEPSQIQDQIIPVLLAGGDAIGQAQTGTGKTLAFGAPMISLLDRPKGSVSGLVLAPTRELAVQVSDELTRIAAKTRLKILPVFGGAPIDRQMKALRDGVDIVVGTPGRVMDLIHRGKLDLSEISFFVLDEADEMLNMGFIEPVEEILEHASSERQTLLFSATMPDPIKKLSQRFMASDARHITIEKVSLTVDLVEQYYFEIKHRDRFESLCRILDATSHSTVIIFCNTKRNVDALTEHLKGRGYNVEGMHGDISQVMRLRTLNKFREGNIEFLVATDVAARGIDVENISHVINYDLPQDLEAYVHRIGRTGRAGRTGTAFSLVTPREYMDIKRIEKMTHSHIRRKDIPTVEDIFQSKYQGILEEVRQELQQDEFRKFLPQVMELDEEYNLAELSAALMMLRYREEVSFDYTKNKLEEADRYARIFITVGRMDGLNPIKLLKFLQGQMKIDPRAFGQIEIEEKFSFFEVREESAQELMELCRGKKFLGRKVAMELAEKKKRKGRMDRETIKDLRARSSRKKKKKYLD